jgi:hypothetical protein
LPRSWRWCTSYSSVYKPAGPQAARLRSNQCADLAQPGPALRKAPCPVLVVPEASRDA